MSGKKLLQFDLDDGAENQKPLSDRLKMGVLQFRRIVYLGMKSLWLHRLRSLLTVLGIVFGVCSVIAMLAIGEGASFEAREQIRSLGSNNIIVRSVKPPQNDDISTERSRVLEYGLTYKDVSQIRATIPGVRILIPARIVRENVWHLSRRVDCDIKGTVPWYPEMRNHPVARGRFFTDIEQRNIANVCVLGPNTAERLFPMGGGLGRTVRVGSDYYRVVGIMASQSSSGSNSSMFGGGSQGSSRASQGSDHSMFIPLSAARELFGETTVRRQSGSFEAERVELHEVTVQVAQLEQVVPTSQIIADILSRQHDKQDYEIQVPLQQLRAAERTTRIFNIVLGAIAAISLIVGGIGIMNIMLASVTERTREIGIRRAMGAKKSDIVMQFLIETVLLSATGGAIGVVLGVAIPFFIEYFADMATIVTLWSPVVAFSISALVGIVFGIYPALRAANMDPVEALRYE